MTKVIVLALALGWAALFTVACTQTAENCFAKASTDSGQEGNGQGSEGSGFGAGSGKSSAAAESGCSKTPVD